MQDNKGVIDIVPEVNPEIYSHFQRLTVQRKEENIRSVPILEARNVVKRYGEHTVIPGLNFVIDDIEGKTEVVSILGPSGCGKSTVLQLIAGLTAPTEGEMLAFGKKIEGPSMDRGMIFQKYSSFPFLTVLDNVAYPLIQVKKMNKKEAREKAKVWIDKMYLTGAEQKYPYQLSGGMQQRVAIARSLCMNARILLMDEPFGALDRKIRWEMQDLMAEILFLKPENECTVLLVTHDIPEAVYLGDRIWIINKGELFSAEFAERPEEPSRIAQGRKKFQDMVSYFNEQIGNLSFSK